MTKSLRELALAAAVLLAGTGPTAPRTNLSASPRKRGTHRPPGSKLTRKARKGKL